MYKKILVPIDLQDIPGSKRTLESVKEYASDDMELEIVTVLPGFNMPLVASYFPEDMVQQALGTMRQELTSVADEKLGNSVKYSVWVTTGKVAKRIVARAEEIDADLILIRAQQHGAIEHVMMGSVTAKVVELAKCSVLVVKPAAD